ncbi:hypothetical protein PK28_02610 [Hymenobacter sp. DG25B]|uniref:hypothetical protein n=1 Tax=Hymenobacter sp. DG25B TaxID=1385664 RepID=UPI000540B609|nr:hypothetical protein [Hymenobacter sp. DG25B]AIZ62850.1 hypothetical protein PK28_02610 [Hymenobacter sp. DG25B]
MNITPSTPGLRRYWFTPWAVLLVIILLGALLFGPVLWHPGNYLFGNSEDGFKNYYTALWYVQHNAGLWFTGMNYPFGEHVVYTDNQPLFSLVLRSLRQAGLPLEVVTVFNSAMLLAQLLSALPLLGLLRRLPLPDWYAATVTVCMVLLAPQLERLLGHYALSYSCAVPLLWYLLVRAQETGNRLWYLLYGATMLLFGGLHPYYIIIGALLLLVYSAVAWWQRPVGSSSFWRFWWPVLTAALLPMVIFQGVLRLTDPYAADRTSLPYGFFAYSSSFWSVFFPVELPTRTWWQSIFHTPDPSWEGLAYVGLVGTTIAVLTLARVLRRVRRKQWRRLRRPALPPMLRVSLWAATLILLFSMGWPFRWGLEGLLNYLGPIRQFRSIGRFAWIFYYFYSVYLAYTLYQAYRWLRWHRPGKMAGSVLALGLLFWFAEGMLNAGHKGQLIQQLQRGPNRQMPAAQSAPDHFRNRLVQAGHQPSDFQAIIPLPYFLMGSEVMSLPTEGHRVAHSMYQGMRASLETELPMATHQLSRTALYQAQELGQLLSHPAIDKVVLRRLPNQKPLLLIVDTKTPLDSAETALLARARVFYRDSAVWLAELPLSQLEARPALQASFRKQLPKLHRFPTYWASAATPLVWHNGFDKPKKDPDFQPNISPLVGPGAQPVRRAPELYFHQNIPQPGWYEASLWVYLRTEKLPALHWSLTNAAGTVLDSSAIETKFSTNVLGDWVRVTAHIHVTQPGQRVRIWTQGRRYVVDEFELRPTGVAVWRQTPDSSQLIYNNYLLTSPLPMATPLATKR